jgi:hypothetical protein
MGAGRQAENVVEKPSQALGFLSGQTAAASDPRVAQLLAQYGSGQLSLQDALSQGGSAAGSASKAQREAAARSAADKHIQTILASVPEQLRGPVQQQLEVQRERLYQDELSKIPDQAGSAQAAMADLITTNPLAAQKYLSDTVRNDPTSKRLFGEGGEMDRSIQDTQKFMQQGDEANAYAQTIQGEERDLASRGYSLTPEDHEAYGQMSDELARTAGAQEKGLSRSLAARGLGSAPSGQAARLFSGVQGNKFEQLANAQRSVAESRMNSNRQRLNDTRQFLGQQQNNANSKYGLGQNARGQTTNLGNLQDQYMSNLFNRNLSGRQQKFNEQMGAAGQQFQQAQANQNQINTGFQQVEQTRGPTAGEVLGGIGGAALGGLTGGITGTLGKSIGSGIGSSLFPKKA